MYTFSPEASRGAGAQSGTVKSTGCGFDPHSGGEPKRSASQHAIPPELGGKW